MRIKKININGYPVYIYNTREYSTIHMRFLFQMPYTRDNIYKSDVLEEYMIHTTKKYNTRKKLSDACMECYSMDFGISNFSKGEMLFTAATFNFYDPALVNDNYFRSAAELAGEILFNPNFINGKSNKEEIDRCKTNMINYLADNLLDPGFKASKDFKETLYPNTYKMIDRIDSKEEYEELLNSYTDEDLLEMHDKLINHSLVGLVIMGNIKDEYLSIIEEIFKFKSTKEMDRNFKEKLKICTKTEYHRHLEDSEAKDSILRVVYECPGRSMKERFAYSAISSMLNKMGMVLHKTLRDELKIVYSTKCTYIYTQGIIILSAAIDGANEEKAVEGFDIALKRLENPEFIEEMLNKLREEHKLDLYVFNENKWNPFGELCDKSFKLDLPTAKERFKIIDSLEVDDILKALSRIKKVKIHFYEGVRK